MKVLLDTNVVLDVILLRAPFVTTAQKIWAASDAGRISGYICATTLPTVFYIVQKSAGFDKAREAVRVCLDAFDVCAVDSRALQVAFGLPGTDFEDNLQIATAMEEAVDVIVTRDPKGFAHSSIRVETPDDFANSL
jgi:predicted nucleic acid-binding protein